MHYKKELKKTKPVAIYSEKDWLMSHIMLNLAIEEILKRVKLDRSYDIPYLAGYSKDGKTIYIDRHMPESFVSLGCVIQTDRFLILHETVEKTLIDKLKLRYQFAHQIALRAEQSAVRADKISWREYDRFTQRYVKEIGSEELLRVPVDLDTRPYRDEHDKELLAKIEQVIHEQLLNDNAKNGAVEKDKVVEEKEVILGEK